MIELKRSIVSAALVAVAAGCALRSPGLKPLAASGRLCGSPERVVVAEFKGDEGLRFDATDSLASGLEALGFRVLAPRRPLPATACRKPAPVDWVFGGEVRRKPEDGLELKVDVRSLRERRRVWAIVDTLPDDASGGADDVLRRTVETALAKFEIDVLSCRAPTGR